MRLGPCHCLWTVLVCAVCLSQSGVLGAKKKAARCEVVQSRCMSRMGCAMALHNFFVGCNAVIYGDTEECTVPCTRALISLLSSDDEVGTAFTECDCANVSSCLTRKRRVEVCSKSVLAAIKTLNDTTVVSCSLARWLCEADSSCLTALDYYVGHCEQLLTGIKCSARCNHSLAILYQQAKAAKLINCACEGTEDFDCVQLRRNTEKMCFNRDVPYQQVQENNRTSGAAPVTPIHVSGLFLWVCIASLVTTYVRVPSPSHVYM